MHVACHCGNRLAVSVDRLPTKIRCNQCSCVFHVSEDGRLREIDGEFVPVRTRCRCGQAFAFRAEQFPHRLGCHMCGRHFDVFDDGANVDADAMPGQDKVVGDRNASTAIQSDPAPSIRDPHSARIATEETIEHLKQTSLPTAEGAEVKIIDLLWKTERPGYSLIPFGGIQIMPSKQSAMYIGFVLLISWLIAFGPALMMDHGGLLGLVLRFGVAPSVFLPIYIYVRAHAYERAERDWQRKRIVAIARCESAEADE